MKAHWWVISLALIVSCSNSKEAELNKLKDEVMVVHDEVMPLMDPLYQIRRDLQKEINKDTAKVSSRTRETILAIQEIQKAEDAMMGWMRNFDLTYRGKTDSLTILYFSEKKSAIEVVAREMRAAQARGEALLEK